MENKIMHIFVMRYPWPLYKNMDIIQKRQLMLLKKRILKYSNLLRYRNYY